jgi:hypothetical protein
MESDSAAFEGGVTGTAHPEQSTGAHRGKGRHVTNMPRSIRGAGTTPMADKARPEMRPASPPQEFHPPHGRGTNPA